MNKSVFFIAGEASGDVLGGRLMAAMRTAAPGVNMEGIGGETMQEQGLESLLPMEELCVMGLWEVAWQLPRLIRLIQGVVEEIERRQPDILVTIDLPDFNFRVAERLKKRGKFKGKIIHYVAPTVWAWRPGRAAKIAQFLDGLVCLFPFEPPYFEAHGLKTIAAGHPLVESEINDGCGDTFREKHDIPPDDIVLGVFLGSREREIKTMGPVFQEALGIITEQYENIHLVFPTIKAVEYDVIQWGERYGVPGVIVRNQEAKFNAYAACNAGLAVSGTIGLELAYAGLPHMIAYKMHPLSWLAVRMMVKTRYAHLGNILLDKPVVPEYLQGRCNPIDVAKGILTLLKTPERGQKQRENFKELRSMLGADQDLTPSRKAAQFILSQ